MTILKIEIDAKDIPENISGTSKNGKEYDIWKQKAYVHLPDQRYPVMIEVTVDSKETAYKAGFYTIDPSSYYVGDFNQLSMRYMKLLPLTEAQLKAVA